ncbi:MAG: hypothetical protein HY647_11730 [Acidobacteria bacterium]|nr:hypothetical protein [Acidobacteriota bacterium]
MRGKLHGLGAVLVVAGFVMGGTKASALPDFLLRFSLDPFSRLEYRNQCSTCHMNPQGGGPRNPFGSAFEKNNHLVTPEFRRAWPSHFLPSVSAEPVRSEAGEVKATFSANEQEILLQVGGQYFRLRPKQAKLEPLAADEAARLLAAPPPLLPPAEEPKLPLRNQPTFDHYLVNLPTTLPYSRGGMSLRFTHRFTRPVFGYENFGQALGDLFSFDSFSFSSLGGAVGLTNWLAATLYRSPLDKTIEMGGVVQLLRQERGQPASAAFRVSVEGRNNFKDFYTTNLVFPLSRSFSNVAEVFVVPTASFNANPFADFATPFTPEGETRSHQAAIGVGASLRFRPRTAFVVEWMPRVAGFHGRDSRNTVSFGILRSTNAHVFELVLTNSLGTTTSRVISGGTQDFTLGFNLYRRLR